jgi:hypothetical protein
VPFAKDSAYVCPCEIRPAINSADFGLEEKKHFLLYVKKEEVAYN